jgi:hypothetical protein
MGATGGAPLRHRRCAMRKSTRSSMAIETKLMMRTSKFASQYSCPPKTRSAWLHSPQVEKGGLYLPTLG